MSVDFSGIFHLEKLEMKFMKICFWIHFATFCKLEKLVDGKSILWVIYGGEK